MEDRGKFNIKEFNTDFGAYLESRKNPDVPEERQPVPKLQPKIHQQNIGNILQKTMETVFRIIDDLIILPQYNWKTITSVFTKKNRLFYVGIFICLLAMILLLCKSLFS